MIAVVKAEEEVEEGEMRVSMKWEGTAVAVSVAVAVAVAVAVNSAEAVDMGITRAVGMVLLISNMEEPQTEDTKPGITMDLEEGDMEVPTMEVLTMEVLTMETRAMEAEDTGKVEEIHTRDTDRTR